MSARPSTRRASVPLLAVLALLAGCADDGPTGPAGGIAVVSSGRRDGNGGRAGAPPATCTTYWAGGISGAAGADTGVAGAASGAGGAGGENDFAAFFEGEPGCVSACTLCLRARCTAENAACGDTGAKGDGACRTAAKCLPATYRETQPNYDCAFEACGEANAAEEVNAMFACVAARCATDCFVTPKFASCDE